MSINRFRFIALITAMLLYALFSTPTPDSPGIAEAIIGLCLIIACAPSALQIVTRPLKPRPQWQNTGIIALMYSLTIPLLKGLLTAENAPIDIARDLIPTLYLFIPLFCYDIFDTPYIRSNTGRNLRRIKIFIATLCFMAISFALRSLPYSAESLIIKIIEFIIATHSPSQEPTYLANAPTLLFTASLAYSAFLRYLPPKTGTLKLSSQAASSAIAAIAIIITALCLLAMQIPLQRASITAFIALAALSHIAAISENPIKGSILLAAALFLAATAITTSQAHPLTEIYLRITEKTRQVGLNLRLEEWSTITHINTSTMLNTLLGTGWGGGFHSPAIHGDYATFAHGFIAATWLKTGLSGLIIYGVYLASLAVTALKDTLANIKQNMILAASIAAPLAICISLYGAYKSLEFGLLLLLTTLIPQGAFILRSKAKNVT